MPDTVLSSVKKDITPGIYHEVKPGQTLWSIAQAYGVDLGTLVDANRLTKTAVLRIGQKLYIPGATQARTVVSRCPCKSSASSPPQPPKVPAALSPPSARQPQDLAKTVPLRFLWPLQGAITRGFQTHGQQRHDGIDIAAPEGTLIRAAADGKVIFSDWGPGGYGRIVILRHKAGVVTVYAHNHRNLVAAGQVVRQGQHIAAVGRSGRASGTHLHFEVRHKTVPVSPWPFLSPLHRVATSDASL